MERVWFQGRRGEYQCTDIGNIIIMIAFRNLSILKQKCKPKIQHPWCKKWNVKVDPDYLHDSVLEIQSLKTRENVNCKGVKVDPRFYFRLNCTSDSGHPAPDLAWFINGKMAEPRQLLHYPVLQHENGDQHTFTITHGEMSPCNISGLQTAILGLQFTVFRLHLLGPLLEIDLRLTFPDFIQHS